MPKLIEPEILTILSEIRCEDNLGYIDAKLDRPTYLAVNKVLEAVGAKWNRKLKAHVFDGSASESLGDVVATGQYLDLKQELQFFETPRKLALYMSACADLHSGDLVLEPSAGKGAIIRAIGPNVNVHGYEINPDMAAALRDEGFDVLTADFLSVEPEPKYNAVVMNPPFKRSQDIDHVRHAHQFIQPLGALVAVMSPGFTFRQDRKAREFRDWLDEVGGRYQKLPVNTFKDSGTGVNTIVVTIGEAEQLLLEEYL